MPTLKTLIGITKARGRKAGSQYKAAIVLVACGLGNTLVTIAAGAGTVCLAPVSGVEMLGRGIATAGVRLKTAVAAATAAAATSAAVANATPVTGAEHTPPPYGSTEPAPAGTADAAPAAQQSGSSETPIHKVG